MKATKSIETEMTLWQHFQLLQLMES
jgi:hypothetical protein